MRRALLVLLLTACGSKPVSTAPGQPTAWVEDAPAAAEAFPPKPPYVVPGERMAYRLSMHGLEVATFKIAVGAPGELQGRPVIVVQSGVEASPLVAMVKKVEDHFTSWIDAATSRTVLFRASELASANDQNVEQTDAEAWNLEDGSYPVKVRRADGSDEETVARQLVGTSPVFDLNSFLMVLRDWDAPASTTATADVIRSRFTWRTQVTMVGFETVPTDLGDLPAIRIDGKSRRLERDGTIDPKSDTRHYSLWISDDADRVPLLLIAKTDYGDIRMEIVEYVPGTGSRPGS